MNENDIQPNNMKEEVWKKIKDGDVSMKPRSHFVLKIFLIVVVSALTFLVSTVLVSYIIFSLRMGGHLFLLGFGARGFYEFLLVFPWVALLIDAILLLFLDWLLKQFKFGYHSPIIYLFLGTLGVITLFASLIDVTPFHRDLMYKAEGKGLPLAGGLYDGLRKSHQKIGIFRGEVVSVASSTFYMQYDDYDTPGQDGSIEVVAPYGMTVSTFLSPEDEVFVAGDVVSGEVRAYGIRKLAQDE